MFIWSKKDEKEFITLHEVQSYLSGLLSNEHVFLLWQFCKAWKLSFQSFLSYVNIPFDYTSSAFTNCKAPTIWEYIGKLQPFIAADPRYMVIIGFSPFLNQGSQHVIFSWDSSKPERQEIM